MNIKQQITVAVEHMLNNDLDYVPLNGNWDSLTQPNCMFVTNYDSDTKQDGIFLFMGDRNLGKINL